MPCSTIGYRATDLSLSLTRIEALHNCIYEINGHTKKQNYTNFKSNLAMMMIYLPVKFEFDWTKRFLSWSPETEMLTDRQMDKRAHKITPIAKGTYP